MLTSVIRLRIQLDVIVRVSRNLEGKGKLNVSVGQEVFPDEIIGSSLVSGGFVILNLPDLLDIPQSSFIKYLKRKLGGRIYKGELLAYKGGWLLNKGNVVVCPMDGILDFINEKTGDIRITRLPQKQDLPAGVYGIVEKVDQSLGQVVIRTQVSKVFGVCGSGKIRDGTLSILTSRSDLTTKSMISPKYDSHILVNGGLISKEVILSAISFGISGIITGGINAADYKSIAGRLVFPKRINNDIGISIIVCEGFGSQPIGEDIYDILSQYEGRFVTIDGNRAILNLPSFNSECMIKIRKTQLPQNEIEVQAVGFTQLNLGQKVRVVGTSYSAEQGKIIAIDKMRTLLPSKISAYLLTIETRRRKIQVPVSNIEVIG